MNQLDVKKTKWSEEARIRLKKFRNDPEYIANISGKNSPRWRGGISRTPNTSYEAFKNKIPDNIKIRRDPNNYYILQTICNQCGEWFSPNKGIMRKKSAGKSSWNLFCSKNCYGKYWRSRSKKHNKTKKHVQSLQIKTMLYKQLLEDREHIKKLNKKLKIISRILANKRKLEQKKRCIEKKHQDRLGLLKNFKVSCPSRYNIYKNSTTSLWFEINRWKNPKEWRIHRMLVMAKQRAKNLNIPFNLDKNWCRERINNCEATNIPFDNSYEGTFNKMNPYAASIDRINNNKGYTKDNCRLVLTSFNSLKAKISDEELYISLKKFIDKYEN